MNENLTDITFLVDRSSSMWNKKTMAESAMKELIDGQRVGVGKVNLSVVEFDFAENRTQINTVINAQPIENVNGVVLNPRGGTPLYDAICTVVDDTGKRLANTPEHERPAKVMFVIVTDGEENSSRLFNISNVRERINRQEKQYNWMFMYVGCDHDAIKAGEGLGLTSGKVMNFASSEIGIKNLGKTISSKLSNVRGMTANQYAAYNTSSEIFTADDREAVQELSK